MSQLNGCKGCVGLIVGTRRTGVLGCAFDRRLDEWAGRPRLSGRPSDSVRRWRDELEMQLERPRPWPDWARWAEVRWCTDPIQ
jgi:hypothetical protein